jgi:glycosyltransferase involved in cell wall biosynthesis
VKVLHIVNSMHPRLGGPPENISHIAAYLRSKGHDVHVASFADPPDAAWFAELPMPAIGLGPSLGTWGYNRKIKPWLEQNLGHFDAVIINGLWQFPARVSYEFLVRRQIPYFVYPHGMLDPWSRRAAPLKYAKKFIYWYLWEYRLLRDAAAVFFTTEQEAQLARQYFPRWSWRPVVVGAGIKAAIVDRRGAAERTRSLLKIAPEEQVVLFLGRVHEKKGVDLLIQAFASLAAIEHIPLRLVIAGEGTASYEAKLRALCDRCGISARVRWAGMVRGPTKWDLLATADIFVLASHQENFGIAVTESLASGTPVIISDQVNICEEIRRDDAGLICHDDKASLERALREWLVFNAERQAAMRLNARRCFEDRFSIEIAGEKVEAELLQAIAQRRTQ